MAEELSILMPVYNVENYVKKSIESVLNQTSGLWKLIIVDDGSTDSSGAICDEYEKNDSRIMVIHKENGGSASARKAGVAVAATEYCIFLDSDDMLAPECVEKVLETITSLQADIVIYTFLSWRDGKTSNEVAPLTDEPRLIQKQSIQKLLLSTNDYNCLWTKAIRTEYLKSDPLTHENIAYNMGEDKLFLLYPVTAANRIAAIPDALYYYRQRLDSISHTYSYHKLTERMQIGVFDHLYEYMKLWSMDSEFYLEQMSTMFWKNLVGIYNIISGGECSNEDSERIFRYNYKSTIPPYILPYRKCTGLSRKEMIKIWLLTGHHEKLAGIV